LEHDVVDLQGCVFKGCQDVFALQQRVVGKDFFKRSASAEQLQNVYDPDALAPNARTSPAFVCLNGNPLEQLRIHKLNCNISAAAEKSKGRNQRSGLLSDPATLKATT
jgi:hypothetical protein